MVMMALLPLGAQAAAHTAGWQPHAKRPKSGERNQPDVQSLAVKRMRGMKTSDGKLWQEEQWQVTTTDGDRNDGLLLPLGAQAAAHTSGWQPHAKRPTDGDRNDGLMLTLFHLRLILVLT